MLQSHLGNRRKRENDFNATQKTITLPRSRDLLKSRNKGIINKTSQHVTSNNELATALPYIHPGHCYRNFSNTYDSFLSDEIVSF